MGGCASVGRWSTLAAAAVVGAGLVHADTAHAQADSPEGGAVRVLLVSTPGGREPVDTDALARTLRAQLAGGGAELVRKTATPDARHERSRTAWGRDMARLHEVDAVTWVEPGEQPGSARAWLLDARERGPRARWIAVPKASTFDMLRTLALSVLSLLGRDVSGIGDERTEAATAMAASETESESATASETETESASETESESETEAEPTTPAGEVEAGRRIGEASQMASTAVTEPASVNRDRTTAASDTQTADTRAAPAPPTDDEPLQIAGGGEMGAVVRAGGPETALGWALRGHLRGDHVSVELGFELLREERWLADEGNLQRRRNRFPVTLSLRAIQPAGPIDLEGGVGLGVTVSKLEQRLTGVEDSADTDRVVGAAFRIELGARWTVAEDLYVTLPLAIAIRATTWGEDRNVGPSSVPALEVVTGLTLGLGR